jgi:hypothetical protein
MIERCWETTSTVEVVDAEVALVSDGLEEDDTLGE